jgi:hypothetical protein
MAGLLVAAAAGVDTAACAKVELTGAVMLLQTHTTASVKSAVVSELARGVRQPASSSAFQVRLGTNDLNPVLCISRRRKSQSKAPKDSSRRPAA